jgi:hypothetical protein
MSQSNSTHVAASIEPRRKFGRVTPKITPAQPSRSGPPLPLLESIARPIA